MIPATAGHCTARPAGKQVHAGPLDTAEDFAKVPEAYREWVRELAPREAELEADK